MRTEPHVRVEVRKVYVSVRGAKLTKHAAYIAAAKKLIADRCAALEEAHNVDREEHEFCVSNDGPYACRFHELTEEHYDHEGQPVDGSGRMVHYHRVLPRLVRFLKFVDKHAAPAAPAIGVDGGDE